MYAMLRFSQFFFYLSSLSFYDTQKYAAPLLLRNTKLCSELVPCDTKGESSGVLLRSYPVSVKKTAISQRDHPSLY